MSSLGNKEIMAQNILSYMELHRKSRTEICDALDIKYTTFTDWVTAKTYPRIDKIELMANYFGIQKSDLVEKKPTAEIDSRLSPEERQMVEAFRSANAERKRAALFVLTSEDK